MIDLFSSQLYNEKMARHIIKKTPKKLYPMHLNQQMEKRVISNILSFKRNQLPFQWN